MGATFMIRKIRSGKVEELIKFRVSPNVKPRSGRKKGMSTARKQDANERDCIKRLARLINCNFSHGDLWLSPNYGPDGMDKLYSRVDNPDDLDEIRAAAEHELDLFIRRIKRYAQKSDDVIKYIAVTADIDGATGECVRVHHHIVISGDAFCLKDKTLLIGGKSVNEIWGNGTVDYQPLRNQADYTPLAQYMIKQVRRQPDAKKYKPSRKLDKPVLVSETLVSDASEIKPPKGAVLLHRNEYEPDMPQYIRYIPATAIDRKMTRRVKPVRRADVKHE